MLAPAVLSCLTFAPTAHHQLALRHATPRFAPALAIEALDVLATPDVSTVAAVGAAASLFLLGAYKQSEQAMDMDMDTTGATPAQAKAEEVAAARVLEEAEAKTKAEDEARLAAVDAAAEAAKQAAEAEEAADAAKAAETAEAEVAAADAATDANDERERIDAAEKTATILGLRLRLATSATDDLTRAIAAATPQEVATVVAFMEDEQLDSLVSPPLEGPNSLPIPQTDELPRLIAAATTQQAQQIVSYFLSSQR